MAVLDTTAAIAGKPDQHAIEGRLFRSRALLKLLRPEEVLAELPEAEIAAIDDADARCTAWMLRGAAIARLDAARGTAQLAALTAEAAKLRVHPALRAEIAYFRALALWSAGELDAAEQHARTAERSGRDVLAVRSTYLRAFVAMARWRYADALALFRAAARAYGHCRERDIDLATSITHQIASLEQSLRSAVEAGSHRSRKLPGAAFGPAIVAPDRLGIGYDDAWLYALDGDAVAAFRKARETDQLAQTLDQTPWRVWTLANQAAIAAAFGEYAGAQSFADAADKLAATVNWDETRDTQRFALLQIAEVRAIVAPATALDALRRYDAVSAPMDRTLVQRDRTVDARMLGWDAFVRGLVLRAQGHHDVASARFAEAAEAFRLAGYLWRRALALIELSATTHEGDQLDCALAIVSEHFPRSFLVRRFGAWAQVRLDPVGASLTPTQREVLRFLLEGYTGPQIASLTARSYNTIRQHVQALHRAFGTHAEHQLVVVCAQRGIGAPSWAPEVTSAHAAIA